jgi:hypothetical protein
MSLKSTGPAFDNQVASYLNSLFHQVILTLDMIRSPASYDLASIASSRSSSSSSFSSSSSSSSGLPSPNTDLLPSYESSLEPPPYSRASAFDQEENEGSARRSFPSSHASPSGTLSYSSMHVLTLTLKCIKPGAPRSTLSSSIHTSLTSSIHTSISSRQSRRSQLHLTARQLAIRTKLEPILFPAPKPFAQVIKSLFSLKWEKEPVKAVELSGEERIEAERMIRKYWEAVGEAC